MSADRESPGRRRAIVVFCGDTDLPWLRMLKSGFRHCFVILEQRGGWVSINPLSHHTEVAWLDSIRGEDIVWGYRRHGFRVVTCALDKDVPLRAAPWRPYTCVETVKRALGIHRGSIWTPWSLYRHLTKKKNSFI